MSSKKTNLFATKAVRKLARAAVATSAEAYLEIVYDLFRFVFKSEMEPEVCFVIVIFEDVPS